MQHGSKILCLLSGDGLLLALCQLQGSDGVREVGERDVYCKVSDSKERYGCMILESASEREDIFVGKSIQEKREKSYFLSCVHKREVNACQPLIY